MNADTLSVIKPTNTANTTSPRKIIKKYITNDTILLFSAGMGSKPLINRLIETFPECTYLDTGSAFDFVINNPKCGEVYNIGGSRYSNCSILEAIKKIDNLEKITNVLFSNKRKMINKNIL